MLSVKVIFKRTGCRFYMLKRMLMAGVRGQNRGSSSAKATVMAADRKIWLDFIILRM